MVYGVIKDKSMEEPEWITFRYAEIVPVLGSIRKCTGSSISVKRTYAGLYKYLTTTEGFESKVKCADPFGNGIRNDTKMKEIEMVVWNLLVTVYNEISKNQVWESFRDNISKALAITESLKSIPEPLFFEGRVIVLLDSYNFYLIRRWQKLFFDVHQCDDLLKARIDLAVSNAAIAFNSLATDFRVNTLKLTNQIIYEGWDEEIKIIAGIEPLLMEIKSDEQLFGLLNRIYAKAGIEQVKPKKGRNL